MTEPDTYLVAHIHEALATDPEIAELHVQATVAGGKIYLTGTVGTDERRRRITEVVEALAPDHQVCNETTVLAAEGAGREERLT